MSDKPQTTKTKGWVVGRVSCGRFNPILFYSGCSRKMAIRTWEWNLSKKWKNKKDRGVYEVRKILVEVL